MHRGVVDENTSLLHLLNVTKAQRGCPIPANADKHDFQWVVDSFENLAKGAMDQTLADIMHSLHCPRSLMQHNPQSCGIGARQQFKRRIQSSVAQSASKLSPDIIGKACCGLLLTSLQAGAAHQLLSYGSTLSSSRHHIKGKSRDGCTVHAILPRPDSTALPKGCYATNRLKGVCRAN